MRKTKFFISLILTMSVLIVQVGGVFAAPALQGFPPITGTVQSITIETDPSTGITTVIVDVKNSNQVLQTIRVSQKTAEKLGLVMLDGDGKPVINDLALGQSTEIKQTMVIPDQEDERHPVGNALEAFFSDIEGLDYKLIMDKHNEGLGFGVIAQALWLTRQTEGNSADFLKLVHAKQTGDYSEFNGYLLEDGTSPMNWGQLRKAILQTNKKDSSDIAVSNQNNNANGNNKDKDKDKDKDKSDSGNGNGKEKDKDK